MPLTGCEACNRVVENVRDGYQEVDDGVREVIDCPDSDLYTEADVKELLMGYPNSPPGLKYNLP